MRTLAHFSFAFGSLVAMQMATNGLHGQEPPTTPDSKTRAKPAYRIRANAPLESLLPAAPLTSQLQSAHIEDLSKVTEIAFAAPASTKQDGKKERILLGQQLAKIAHVNKKSQDEYMRVLIANRPDLQGLAFLLGDECRMPKSKISYFSEMVQTVRANDWSPPSLETQKAFATLDALPLEPHEPDPFHQFYELARLSETGKRSLITSDAHWRVPRPAEHHPAAIAALMQILAPESTDKRLGLAKFLASVSHIDATKALAQLALYAPETEVRQAAIDGLKLRRERDYTAQLLAAFDYPYPPVAKRAAEALVQLRRDDLLRELLAVLDQPDPREPKPKSEQGKKSWTVRELIRVNHHRNCLLCHAPCTEESLAIGGLPAPIPLTTHPLPESLSAGNYFGVPHFTPLHPISADVTYIRQDFSLMLRVADAAPWPEMQRFDFLVRTREISEEESRDRRRELQPKQTGEISPYHAAALYALRELTGRDAEPTADAWRALLRIER